MALQDLQASRLQAASLEARGAEGYAIHENSQTSRGPLVEEQHICKRPSHESMHQEVSLYALACQEFFRGGRTGFDIPEKLPSEVSSRVSQMEECLHMQASRGCENTTEIQRLQTELQRVSAAAARQEQAAHQQVASIRNEAEQRQMQLAVILETLEALQSGSDGGQESSHATLLCFDCPCSVSCLTGLPFTVVPLASQISQRMKGWLLLDFAGALEQRVVTLTAELAASRQEHAAASERTAELERQLQEATSAAGQLQSDLEAARAATERTAASEGAAKASEQAARQDLEACRSARLPR